MKIVAAAVVAIVVAGIGYTLWARHETTFRYRLTVEVASGGLIYTGSGVIEVQIGIPIVALNGIAATPRVTGDAVVVEVPHHPPIFVLLTAQKNSDWDSTIAFKLFRDRLPDHQGKSATEAARDDTAAMVRLRAKAEVPRESYPLMVAFRDINRPASVYQVYPGDLSPPLDAGARVISMTIEMTDAPVTYGIEKRLPWLGTTITAYLDGDQYNTPGKSFANSVDISSFRKRGL